MFIDAQHGLSNRLRAVASAHAIAQKTGRRLFVIWCPDAHCEARLEDLFHYSGPVIDDRSTADQIKATSGRVYSYMEVEPGARFQQPILSEDDDQNHRDVYVRSAYSLISPHTDMPSEQRFLRSLQPVQQVLDLVASVPSPSDVAVHIRMATGRGYDHLPYESPDNWPAERHAELADWRVKSHVAHFVKRLDHMLEQGQARTIFAAADLQSTYDVLRLRYGDALRVLERPDFDRSRRQLQYALADLLLLAKAKYFLASSWSSFSDVAQRLAPIGRIVEHSGVDF